MPKKRRVVGMIVEVGWEDNTPTTVRNYAIIRVKLASERRKDVAEKKLREYQKLVGKKATIFVEN